jgi:lipopolysaccharide/colanic/teichoic acid biosynthesis glycosyltransferase
MGKRAIDILGALVGLVMASPVMAAAAVAILAIDGRPVIFSHHRAGLHGSSIRVFKFRTMVRNAEALRGELRALNHRHGPDLKLADDPRVTPVGRFLRRSSIDELPQLVNVLLGQMSLVGPRVQPLDDVRGYAFWHRRRLSVKPGLTGLSQVKARNNRDFDVRVKLDLDYIDNWSLWLDLKLMLLTAPAVLRGTGDYG